MASKGTGFHPLDADYTQGRAKALADAEALVCRIDGLARKVILATMAAQWGSPTTHTGGRNGN